MRKILFIIMYLVCINELCINLENIEFGKIKINYVFFKIYVLFIIINLLKVIMLNVIIF